MIQVRPSIRQRRSMTPSITHGTDDAAAPALTAIGGALKSRLIWPSGSDPVSRVVGVSLAEAGRAGGHGTENGTSRPITVAARSVRYSSHAENVQKIPRSS